MHLSPLPTHGDRWLPLGIAGCNRSVSLLCIDGNQQNVYHSNIAAGLHDGVQIVHLAVMGRIQRIS